MKRTLVLCLLAALLVSLVTSQPDGRRKERRVSARGAANLFQANAKAANERKGKRGKGERDDSGSSGKGEKGRDDSSGGKKGSRGKGEKGSGGSSDKGRMFYDDDYVSDQKDSDKKGRGTDDDDDDNNDSPTVPQPSPAPQSQPATQPSPAVQPTPMTQPTPIPLITLAPINDSLVVVGSLSPVQQSPASQRCSPTVGPCIDSFAAMTSIVDNLPDGNTVAICNESTIRTSSAVTIEADETTLCCAGVNCVVASVDNTDRNLLVTGDTFTVTDVIFEGGSSDVSGGNVAIFGSGNHHILDSRFQGGNSRLRGGNLFISTEGNVLVDGSTFADGTAAIGGGGLAIESAIGVEILSSQFVSNDAPEGGGLFSTRASATLSGQMIMIEDSSFVLNTGEVGGGFLVSNLGELPSLTVLNTDFTENSVDTVGGAAAVVEFLTNLNLKYSSNTGADNVATQFCNGILTAPDASAPACLAVTDEFP